MPTVIAPPAAADHAVQRILLEGMPWQRFEQLSACFEDSRAVRLTYLDGSLEIMSPVGPEHETRKRNISYLLDAYLTVKGIRFYVLEPDGYCRATRSRLLPDLDPALLAAHARMPDQYDAVQAFRRAIA